MKFSIFSGRERRLQETLAGDPVTYDEDRQTWNVCRFADVKQVLSNPTIFSNQGPDIVKHPIAWSFAMADGKRHDTLRSLVAEFFSAEAVKLYQPYITTTANGLLDRIVADGQTDIATNFACPLATMVAAKIIGLPPEDHVQLKILADEQGKQFAHIETSTPTEVIAYFEKAIQARQAERQQDIISRLLDAKIDNHPLSREELLGFIFLLVVAAIKGMYVTTATTLLLMLEHPEMMTELRTNYASLPTLIEEVIRFYPSQSYVLRRPTADAVINNQHIAQGEPVVLWLHAANLDERQFPQPCVLNSTREPNRHVGWGYGPHFCLGRHLAILEIRVAIEVLLTRFREVCLDPERPVQSNDRGEMESLPIRFTT